MSLAECMVTFRKKKRLTRENRSLVGYDVIFIVKLKMIIVSFFFISQFTDKPL